jgi:23S rRNA-/tRNA-specific pseudouridylate synthase
MCYARSAVASFLAYKAFIDKRVLKYYLALVHGHLHASYPIFVYVSIGENASCYGRIMCTNDHPYCTNAKPAQSHIDVLEHGEYDGKPASKVVVRVLTCKRHQIRLHMNYLGHPIIGDYIYTDPIDYKPHRIMLHARSLTIHTDQELIDALAKDPFITQFDPKWKKTKTIYAVNRW